MFITMAVFLTLLIIAFLVAELWSAGNSSPVPKSAYQLEIEAAMRKQDTMHQMCEYAKTQRQ